MELSEWKNRSAMECPVCGDKIPEGAESCPTCGMTVERMKEAGETESPGPTPSIEFPSKKEKKERQEAKSARKKSLIIASISGLVVVALVAVMIVVIAGGTEGSTATTPEQALDQYYEALELSDLQDMLRLFKPEEKPDSFQLEELEEAVPRSIYEVEDLVIETLEEDADSACVALHEVYVTETGPEGKVTEHCLSVDILEIMTDLDSSVVMCVDLEKEGEYWVITDTPYGGWEASNVWVLGDVRELSR